MRIRISFAFAVKPLLLAGISSGAMMAAVTAAGAAAPGYTITTIDVGSLRTEATGINDSGEIVGIYSDQANAFDTKGFSDVSGVIGAINSPAGFTLSLGIASNGSIISDSYVGPSYAYVGGAWKSVSPPRLTQYPNTLAMGINSSGTIVGWTTDNLCSCNVNAFVDAGGTFTFLTTPAGAGGSGAEAFGINDYVDGPHRSTVTANLFRSPPDICLGFPRFLT